jgi:hypothetical protein
MTAEEVALAYQQNEAFVDEYLTSKAIQVGGPVVRVFRVYSQVAKGEMPYVVALESQRRLPVHCFFPAMERKRLAGLRPGEQATIRGTCQGKGDSREPETDSPPPHPLVLRARGPQRPTPQRTPAGTPSGTSSRAAALAGGPAMPCGAPSATPAPSPPGRPAAGHWGGDGPVRSGPV